MPSTFFMIFFSPLFYQETPFAAALTGTADAYTCSVIISTLCLKDPLMVHVSPNRNNLRCAIVSTKKMNDIACVVNYLMMKLEKHAYSSKELCEQTNCLLRIYHSGVSIIAR